MLGGGGHGVTHGNGAQVATLERGVFVTQLAGCDNHTGLYVLAVTGIDDNFLTPDTIILVHKVALVHNLLFQEDGIAGIEDVDLTHHLAHDNFEVLVVDLHALHTVYVLYLVDDVFLHCRRAHDIEDI